MEKRYELSKRVGIIGGMGPAATVALYEQITKRTPINGEQDHLRLMIDSDPTIPDRTTSILAQLRVSAGATGECCGDGGEGMPESPGPYLVAAGKRLEAAGAELLAMACNTAHFWYEQIAGAVGIPMLNLIDVTAEVAQQRCDAGHRIGLLGTDATILAALYPEALERCGLEMMLPEESDQREVMAGIWQVKHGRIGQGHRTLMRQAQALIDQGADGVILGCTDISVVIADGDLSVPVIDSTVALADRIIEEARKV